MLCSGNNLPFSKLNYNIIYTISHATELINDKESINSS